MPRVTNIVATKKRHKRVLKRASGYFANKSRLYRYAREALHRAGCYAYRDRRKKKSEMRALWIVRINAAVRPHGLTYSRFMGALIKMSIGMDRKALSELAIHDAPAFEALVKQAQFFIEQNSQPVNKKS
jgi:large subunit ribosomal protein L20